MTITFLGERSPLRDALLQRLANDMAVAQAIADDPDSAFWPCCWVFYDGYGGHRYIHMLCSDPCDHLHHQAEAPPVAIAWGAG